MSKQKPTYEMGISPWSSDVGSYDLFEADADAAEIIAQLTAKGCGGLGVELRVEAIVRLGRCVDDGEIGIVEVSNAGAKLEIHTLVGFIQIGRAHVCTPVTNAHLVCRLLLE